MRFMADRADESSDRRTSGRTYQRKTRLILHNLPLTLPPLLTPRTPHSAHSSHPDTHDTTSSIYTEIATTSAYTAPLKPQSQVFPPILRILERSLPASQLHAITHT